MDKYLHNNMNDLTPEQEKRLNGIVSRVKSKKSNTNEGISYLLKSSGIDTTQLANTVKSTLSPLTLPVNLATRGIQAGTSPEGQRESFPMVGGAVGMFAPIPGAPISGATLGAGLGEAAAQRFFGEPTSIPKIAGQAALSGATAGLPTAVGKVASVLKNAYPRVFEAFGVFPKITEFFQNEIAAGRNVPKLGASKEVMQKGLSGELEEAVLAPQRAVGQAMSQTENAVKSEFGNKKLFNLQDVKDYLQESKFAKSPDTREQINALNKLIPKDGDVNFDQLIKLKRAVTEGITTKIGKTLKVEEGIGVQVDKLISDKLDNQGGIFEDFSTLSRNFRDIVQHSSDLTGLRTSLSPKNAETTLRRWGSGRFLETEKNALEFLDTQLSYIGKDPILKESLSGIMSPAFRGLIPKFSGRLSQAGLVGEAARMGVSEESASKPGMMFSLLGLQTVPAFRRLELILTQKALQTAEAIRSKQSMSFLTNSLNQSKGAVTKEGLAMTGAGTLTAAGVAKEILDYKNRKMLEEKGTLKEGFPKRPKR